MLIKGSQSEPDVGAKKEIFFPLLIIVKLDLGSSESPDRSLQKSRYVSGNIFSRRVQFRASINSPGCDTTA